MAARKEDAGVLDRVVAYRTFECAIGLFDALYDARRELLREVFHDLWADIGIRFFG